MAGVPTFDGHDQLRGVWGGNPASVPVGFAQQANNRFFREDYNRTRPSIQNITLEFESEEQRAWFEAANGQGATFYNTYPSYISPKIVASLGGRIFTIEVQGRKGIVRQLIDGNSRQFMHAWFAQGFQWLVIQDGIHAPILWDGQNVRRSNLATREVPTGSVMAFIYGRFVVASADGKNSVFVGDIAYGDTVTNPNNILNFTERTYWAEGGNFDTPLFLGNIMGLYAMPFLDTGTGQNELVIGCTGGFASLDLSTPRESWIDNQTQKVALIGSGLLSTHGYAGLNGDMFYRSQDGISTYRNARIEYSQGWRQSPVSREVNYWIKPDRTDLLEFIPMVSFDNMVFTGCSPMLAAPNNPAFGYHRYCRGMTVFDAESMSTAGRDTAPVWHGMWSGIRPWAFARGQIGNAERCFAFSYDRDGRNRLYEITLSQTDDTFGTETRKATSFYLTGEFGTVEAVTNAFAPKKFTGGVIELSEIQGATSFTVEYRPDGSPCWVQVAQGSPGCDCPTRKGTCPTPYSAAQWARKYFQQVNPNQCIPGTTQLAGTFQHCQIRVNMEGRMTVNRLNIEMDRQPDGRIAECLGNQCKPIDCCPAAADYAYHIAPVGTNTNVPDVPDEVITYTATRIYRAVCPNYPLISVIGTATVNSLISQQDANTLAQVEAEQNATEQLVCPDCLPSVEADFFISGGETMDLSGYFQSGAYDGHQGEPWRLINVLTEELIASGVVNASGTLQTYQTFPQYTNGSFDSVTNIYSDTGAGNARIQLQRGCNIGGFETWPSISSYGL